MVKKKVNLKTVMDVQKFNHIVVGFPFDIDLAHDRYIIDAKSIMGIFSLNLASNLDLTVYADESEAKDLLEQLQEFFVK